MTPMFFPPPHWAARGHPSFFLLPLSRAALSSPSKSRTSRQSTPQTTLHTQTRAPMFLPCARGGAFLAGRAGTNTSHCKAYDLTSMTCACTINPCAIPLYSIIIHIFTKLVSLGRAFILPFRGWTHFPFFQSRRGPQTYYVPSLISTLFKCPFAQLK